MLELLLLQNTMKETVEDLRAEVQEKKAETSKLHEEINDLEQENVSITW